MSDGARCSDGKRGRLATRVLAECHLTAGCLFQTVWNRITGRALEWGIKDYDVF